MHREWCSEFRILLTLPVASSFARCGLNSILALLCDILSHTSSQVAKVVKNLPATLETNRFDQFVGKMPWRRKWQHTSIFLPGKFHEQRSLAGYIVHRVPKRQTLLSTHRTLSSSSFPKDIVSTH